MPASTMTYVLSHIRQNIPAELLNLAFKPRKYNTSIENRIIAEIIEGPVLLDTNLVGGKRRDIIMNAGWQMNLKHADQLNIAGTGIEGSFYLVPPEARENRNISSVIGVSSYLGGSFPGSGVGLNGGVNQGNTANGMLLEMLNTRTFANNPITPQVTLEGTNIIRFYPELITDGIALSVMLEYDSEFLNMSPSGLFAMREFCLCATQRYIATQLRVSIDETEIVAGMEIGVIKTLVEECNEKAKDYQALLMKVKGAMVFDPKSLSKLIYHSL